MLASITPLGERGRGNRWGLTAAAYELSSVAGGAAMGSVLGAVGLGLRETVLGSTAARAAAAAAVSVGALALELAQAQGRRPLPSWRRQVDQAWLGRYRGWVYGAGFGLQLGTGLVTIVNSAAMYAFAGLVVTVASPVGGLALGAAFGLTRALPLLAFGRAGDFAGVQRAHRALERLAGPSRSGTVGALAGASVVLITVSVLAASGR